MYRLFALCADIQVINYDFRNGIDENRDKLKLLLDQISLYQDNPQYKRNERLIALVYLESYYHLGCRESGYLENAFIVYGTFIENKDYGNVLDIYKDAENKSARVEGAYLLALYRLKDNSYKDRLRAAVKDSQQSIEDIFSIAFYVEDKCIFEEVMVPAFTELLNKSTFIASPLLLPGLVFLFSRWRTVELLDIVLR